MVRIEAPASIVVDRDSLAELQHSIRAMKAAEAARDQGAQARLDDQERSFAASSRMGLLLDILMGTAWAFVLGVCFFVVHLANLMTFVVPSALINPFVWLLAGLLIARLYAKASLFDRIFICVYLFGVAFLVSSILPVGWPSPVDPLSLPAIALPLLPAVLQHRRDSRGKRYVRKLNARVAKERREYESTQSMPLSIPEQVAWYIIRARHAEVVGERVRGMASHALNLLDGAVAAMRSAFTEHRLSAFWIAVEEASRRVRDVAEIQARSVAYARAWSGAAVAHVDFAAVNAVERALECEPMPASRLTVTGDDGSRLDAWVVGGNVECDESRLLRAYTPPRFAIDEEFAIRLAALFADYSHLLTEADKDFEFASIGQEFLNRAAMKEHADSLRESIAKSSAAVCMHIEQSQRLLGDRIEEATARAAATVAQGIAAATQSAGAQAEALRSSIESIQHSNRGIQNVYVINR